MMALLFTYKLARPGKPAGVEEVGHARLVTGRKGGGREEEGGERRKEEGGRRKEEGNVVLVRAVRGCKRL